MIVSFLSCIAGKLQRFRLALLALATICVITLFVGARALSETGDNFFSEHFRTVFYACLPIIAWSWLLLAVSIWFRESRNEEPLCLRLLLPRIPELFQGAFAAFIVLMALFDIVITFVAVWKLIDAG